MDLKEIAAILNLLRSLPEGAFEDGIKLIQDGTAYVAEVKAFMDKYPQVIEALKQLRGGK